MARTISDTVGIGCKNLRPDVQTVQELLNQVPADQGGPNPPLVPDGGWGTNTQKALQIFQLKQFGWPGADGKAFPNGETMTALNKFDSSGGTPSQLPGLPTVPVPTPPPDVSVLWRIRAVRCGVEELPNGTISDGGYHFELHDVTNARATVFTLVNGLGLYSQFSGKPKIQYREFSFFRTTGAFRVEDFRDVPASLTVFFSPVPGKDTVSPSFGRLQLSMPGGESVVVPVNEFPDYEPIGTVSNTMLKCTFQLDFLIGQWKPK